MSNTDPDTHQAAGISLDETYKHLHPHAFHLQLPRHHKTEINGIPYVTITAQRKSQYIVKLIDGLAIQKDFFHDVNVDPNAMDGDGDDDDDAMNDDIDGGKEGKEKKEQSVKTVLMNQ